MPTLLVVDEDPSILHIFRRAFTDELTEVVTATTVEECLTKLRAKRPDALVLDLILPDARGLVTLEQIQAIDPRLPVVLTTSSRNSESAIQAMRMGAFDYVVKPISVPQLRQTLARAFEIRRLMQVPVTVQDEVAEIPESTDVLVGSSQSMQEVYKSVGRVADQDVTVLILGESGTGKELVARAIYQHSRRSKGPFLAVNCAAIPDSLLESELFGHEKGAFTSADRRRIGRFEQCDNGTLFLDEIGDMAPVLQSKILRVLQEQQFERLGGSETIHTNVRIIAATNRNLEKMVEQGTFRADLYYRLNVFTIPLPPLRIRVDDLPLLLDHYLKRFNRELGRDVRGIAPEALEAIQRYSWPGNVRELQSVLKQALLNSHGPVLTLHCLPSGIRDCEPLVKSEGEPNESSPPLVGLDQLIRKRLTEGSSDLFTEVLSVAERHLITRVLQHTDGNQLRAAKILGIARGSLRKKVRVLNIRIGRSIQADGEESMESDLGLPPEAFDGPKTSE